MNKIFKYAMLEEIGGLGAPLVAKDVRPAVVSDCPTCNFKVLKNMKGKVYAADDKQPLMGATVQNLSTGKYAVTGENGDFAIDASLNDDIEIRFMGYKNVKIKGSQLATTIYMQTETFELEGVTVTPKTKPKVEVKPSLNEQIKKNKKWIWIGLIALGIGIGSYYYGKDNGKKQ